MTFTILLLLLGLIESVYMDPCGGPGCRSVSVKSTMHLRHLDDEGIANSSVAPWHLKWDTMEGREPSSIRKAECESCTVEGLVAKAIHVQIQVHHRRGNKSGGWCMCPYKVAVGCTCVKE